MDSYRMNCRNVSGNCRNRTCGNMTGNRESMIPMDSTTFSSFDDIVDQLYKTCNC